MRTKRRCGFYKEQRREMIIIIILGTNRRVQRGDVDSIMNRGEK